MPRLKQVISKIVKDEILRLFKNGSSASILALEYGVGRASVYRWLEEEKLGKIPFKRTVPESFKKNYKLSSEEKKLIVSLKKEKPAITYKEILAKLKNKVSFRAIFRYLAKAGLTKKGNFKHPSLKNLEKYQKQDSSVLIREYQKFSKDKSHPKYQEIIYSFLLIFRHKGLFSKAVEVGQKILKRKNEFVDRLKAKVKTIEGDIYYHFGDCLRFASKSKKTAYNYSKAYEKLEKSSDEEITLDFVRGLCRDNLTDDSNVKLLIEICNNTSDENIKVYAYNSIAISYAKTRNYTIALKYFKLAIIKDCLKMDELGKSYLNLATCYKNLNEYKNSLKYLNLAEDNTRENVFQIAKIKLGKALVYVRMSKSSPKTEKLFLNSRALFKKVKNERNYLIATCHLALFYQKVKRKNKLEKIKEEIKIYLDIPVFKSLAEKYLEKLELAVI